MIAGNPNPRRRRTPKPKKAPPPRPATWTHEDKAIVSREASKISPTPKRFR